MIRNHYFIPSKSNLDSCIYLVQYSTEDFSILCNLPMARHDKATMNAKETMRLASIRRSSK